MTVAHGKQCPAKARKVNSDNDKYKKWSRDEVTVQDNIQTSFLSFISDSYYVEQTGTILALFIEDYL